MRRIAIPLALALAALAAACGREEAEVTATGTIEVIEVDASPLQAARLQRVWVDEGDTVRAGDTIATLTLVTARGAVGQQEARVEAAEAQLRDLAEGPRAAETLRAEAELRAREAEAARLARDADRYRALVEGGAVSRAEYDQRQTAARVASSQAAAARESLRLLRQGTRPGQVEAARAQVQGARSDLETAKANENELTLVAPVGGVVVGRWREPGEVVGAGQAVVTLGETARPWTRVYLGPQVLPLVKVGQPVTATLDGFPGRPFKGRVVAISERAEFTPRVALTEDEREDLLFGVKVELEDAGGMLKAGLPVTVAFLRAEGGR